MVFFPLSRPLCHGRWQIIDPNGKQRQRLLLCTPRLSHQSNRTCNPTPKPHRSGPVVEDSIPAKQRLPPVANTGCHLYSILANFAHHNVLQSSQSTNWIVNEPPWSTILNKPLPCMGHLNLHDQPFTAWGENIRIVPACSRSFSPVVRDRRKWRT